METIVKSTVFGPKLVITPSRGGSCTNNAGYSKKEVKPCIWGK